MSSFGDNWSQGLSQGPNEEDLQFLADAGRAEGKAEKFFQNLIQQEIPNGIESCLSRRSRRLAVEVPLGMLNSNAWASFREWCEHEQLTIMLGTVRDSGEIVISVQPKI